MRTQPIVLGIGSVYDGDLRVGTIDNRSKKRAYDGLVFFDFGKVEYTFEEKCFTAKSGCVVYLPKNSSYFMDIREDSHYVCIDFEYAGADGIRSSEIFSSGIPMNLGNDFLKLFYLWHRREECYLTDSLGALYQIISVCLHTLSKEYSKSGILLGDAEKYILEKYTSESLTVAKVAEHVGISQTHLRRIFNKNRGISPVEYISYLRLEKAKNMLKSTNCSIGEIAYLCGYCDPAYFSREFKCAVGLPPKEYRIAFS